MVTGTPTTSGAGAGGAAQVLLDGYERSLPQVYGYLVSRCGSAALAEDLTSETYLGAVASIEAGTAPVPTTAWLVGIARHKMVDHWRRQEREQRKLTAVAGLHEEAEDPWDVQLEVTRAREVLSELGPHHRSALVLRYLDGLTVPEVATQLDRTVHATEALLVRARRAFRSRYEAGELDEPHGDQEGEADQGGQTEAPDAPKPGAPRGTTTDVTEGGDDV